jgi:enediyne biosynthesis protein E4
LHIYQNTLEDRGNWIGFRIREGVAQSPVGTQVKVYYPGHVVVRQVVTGDSYRSQHARSAHFGLGNAGRVERVEIRWSSGQTLLLRDPAVNQYHSIGGGGGNQTER